MLNDLLDDQLEIDCDLDLFELAQDRKSQFTGARRKVDRLAWMLKTYPPSQILRRVAKLASKKAGFRYVPKKTVVAPAIRDNAAFSALFNCIEVAPDFDRSELGSSSITLLNQKIEVGNPIDWSLSAVDPKPEHLWRFHLHYHEYLLKSIRNAKPEEASTHWQLVIDTMNHWVENNSVESASADDAAWHPYCISRRIPIWIKILSQIPDRDCSELSANLFDQANSLSRNLEKDLRGNHLLENYHALAMAACYFEGESADQWAAIALAGLKQELNDQVMPWGEHYELSPMYHCVVCANLFELVVASRGYYDDLSQQCFQHAEKMLAFLKTILLPDDEIPLLSDSCFFEAPPVSQIRKVARLADSRELERSVDGGVSTIGQYWIHRSGRDMLLFDAGELAAQGLPGHAHCDLLNLVGSVDGQRYLVDSGNCSYNLDRWRSYCRSSVAHNVMTINQIDHCDVWGKFRMGRRGRPSAFSFGEETEFEFATAKHNCYPTLIRRFVASHRHQTLWVCFDQFDDPGKVNLAEGFLHFGSGVNVQRVDDHKLETRLGSKKLTMQFFGHSSLSLARSHYCIEFGKSINNFGAVYTGSARCSLLGWVLFPTELDTAIEIENENTLVIAVENKTSKLRIGE